jgi:hypothetical protein
LSDSQKAAIASTLEAEKDALEKKKKAERKAALDAFYVDKAAKILSAIMATAQGVISAFQLGPIAGAIAAAAIAAIGAAQIGIIASQKPTFHAGGTMAGDEGLATLLKGEGVLTRNAVAAIGGPQGVDAINRGAIGGFGGGVTVLRIGRMEAREVVRTDIAAGGLIPQAIRRSKRTAGTVAGLSGRGPIA